MSLAADPSIPTLRDGELWCSVDPSDRSGSLGARTTGLVLLFGLWGIVVAIALLRAAGVDADGGAVGAAIALTVGVVSVVTMVSLWLNATVGSALESRRRRRLERLLVERQAAHGPLDERVLEARVGLSTMLGRRGHRTMAARELATLLQEQLAAMGGAESPATVTTRANHVYWSARSSAVGKAEVAGAYEDLAAAVAAVFGDDDPRVAKARRDAATWRAAAGEGGS